jgi:TRAP transporter TAXI family solute receptor
MPCLVKSIALGLALTASALAALAGPSAAEDIKLPSTLTFTAYDTGSSGFNIAVAVGKMLKDQHKAEVRVLPAGNDVARLAPLKANRAQVSAMGIGIFYAQEGVLEFAVKEWGPQPLQTMMSVIDCNGLSLGVAKDTGVKEMKDVKGKRVGFVVGSPALNQNALAMIAFGNLKRDDVKIVEFASYGAMWKGMVNNDVDAAFASTISAQTKEVETSPRGLVWPPLPASDSAGWDRVKTVAPYFTPHKATCGSGMSASAPIEMGVYPYPIFMAYGSQPADLIHGITKAMIKGYDAYKDGAPGAAGLALDKQTMQWVIPLHPGAVRAIKEAGRWTAEDEKHNQGLLKRQQVLADAWAAFNKASPPDDAGQFRSSWMKVRAEALTKAGLPVGFGE